MKTLVGRTGSWLAVVTVALLLGATPARANDFVLNFWNTTEFNLAGSTLTVHVALVSGNTDITFTLNQGTISNTFLGLDKFGYNGPNALTGLDGFTAGGSGQEDGFGNFDNTYASPAFNGLPAFEIAGNHVSDFTSANQFVAHIRFDGSCSGFVGGHSVDATSDSGCKRTSVAEPPILALAGFGLMGLALVSRRWRMQ